MEHSETTLRKPRIAMISGHIDISHSEFATHYHSPLDEAIASGDLLILDDAKGTDEMALDYILDRDPKALQREISVKDLSIRKWLAGDPGWHEAFGRDGLSLEEEWLDQGVATLHGMYTHEVPNLLFVGHAQSVAAANFVMVLDVMAQHIAHLIKQAQLRVVTPGPNVMVELERDAEVCWTAECMKRAAWYAAMSGYAWPCHSREGGSGRIEHGGSEEEQPCCLLERGDREVQLD
ncbi:hypothetical protein ACKAV7_008404 [Fusarium commune]